MRAVCGRTSAHTCRPPPKSGDKALTPSVDRTVRQRFRWIKALCMNGIVLMHRCDDPALDKVASKDDGHAHPVDRMQSRLTAFCMARRFDFAWIRGISFQVAQASAPATARSNATHSANGLSNLQLLPEILPVEICGLGCARAHFTQLSKLTTSTLTRWLDCQSIACYDDHLRQVSQEIGAAVSVFGADSRRH